MKKSKLLFLVLVFVLALALVSCGSDKNPPDVTNEPGVTNQPGQPGQPDVTDQPGVVNPPPPPSDKTLLANWQEYKITYANGASEIITNALNGFTTALNEKYSLSLNSSSDLASTEGELEILVGNTNRPESTKAKEGLRANDFFIGMANKRIVIVGGSDRATANALDFFKANFLATDGLYYPTDKYAYNYDYVVDKLTIRGVDISEFVIVKDSKLGTADAKTVDSLKYAIADICGVEIKVISSQDPEQTHEILVGNTGRALTSKEQKNGTYTVEQTDTKIAIYGKGTNATAAALNKFAAALVSIPAGESFDIKLENAIGASYTQPTLVENNLPKEFADMRDKYDYNVLTAETTFERFLASVEELPDEVTVLDPVELENYPLSQVKKQVYVSASGSDSNSGTKLSPYKTINRALKDMQNQGGGVIWVESGAYSLEEGIVIDATHSGNAISPLFIKSYGEGGVSMTSNVLVNNTSFKLVDIENDEVAARLKEGLEDKVYYVNLYNLGWTEEDIVPITMENGPARMYVDGEEFTLAQFPNAFYEDGVTRREIHDLLYFRYVYDTGSVTSKDGNLYWPWIERVEKDPILTPDSVLGWEIRVLNARDRLADKGDEAMGDEILSWVNTGDIWLYGSTFEGWEQRYYTIDPKCVHSGDLLGTLRRDGYYSLKSVQPNPYGTKVSGNSAAGRNTFILFNAIEALDAPGEWFIDRESGNLYIYPKNDDITNQSVSYSGTGVFDLLKIEGASYVVLDGIGASSSSASAMVVNESNNIIIQNAKIRNTKETSIKFTKSEKSALLYSDLSYSYDYMVSVSDQNAIYALEPKDVFIQNNVFSDTPSTVAYAVSAGGCRTIVSHNHFIDCCLRGSGVEHVIEYNKFEGGNKFVTDGGMVYFGRYDTRGIHIRNNLFHKFHATHNAIYFDTMGSGMYAYNNVISTLGGQANSHQAWYSSTGHGNVCYSNIIVLRNKSQIDLVGGKDTDEGTEAIKTGDTINESGLFYYYYGNNAANNSMAGHWWMDHKTSEINYRLKYSNQSVWNARYPDYMNFLEGTKCILEVYKKGDYKVYYKPQKLSSKTHMFYTATDTVIWVPPYEYLDGNGDIKLKDAQTLTAEKGFVILTYDDIAALERLRRQPAFSVIKNNLILGGSSDPDNVVTNGAENYHGLVKDVTIKDNNYFKFNYNNMLADADNYDYTISDDTWTKLKEIMGADFVNTLKEVDYEKAGLTK